METVTPSIRRERLTELLRVAKAIPARELDMTTFRRERRGCKTVMCLAGHAANDPWFQKLGLELVKQEPTGAQIPGDFAIKYGEDRNFEALARFFGMTDDEADTLFGADFPYAPHPGDKLPTKAQVAANVRRAIRGLALKVYDLAKPPTA